MIRIRRIPLAVTVFVSIGVPAAGGASGCSGKDVAIATNPSAAHSALKDAGVITGPTAACGSSSACGADAGSGVSDPFASKCPAGSPWSCRVSKCAGGAHTTLTGKVYDPAGKVPLSNVNVFVPNDADTLPYISHGGPWSCKLCDQPLGDYVAIGTTDATGSFTLTDVPTGTAVPLVVQTGSWRRTIKVSNIADCATTAVPDSGAGQARLPGNRGEGDMPQMALLTGGMDDLGCFLTRIGISASEYSTPLGTGSVDVYQGLSANGGKAPALSNGTAGDCTNASCPLWASLQTLEHYDLVLLACEGDTFDPGAAADGGAPPGGPTNVTASGKMAMSEWLGEGGRVLATHFQYTWFQNGTPDLQGVANWLGASPETGVCAGCSIDTSLPMGQGLHDWLGANGGLSGAGIDLTGVGTSVSSVAASTNRWIYDGASNSTKYLSFGTPVGGQPTEGGPPRYCGKSAFTDVHAGNVPSGDVPGACAHGDLSPQEKALEFLFFDLDSCLIEP